MLGLQAEEEAGGEVLDVVHTPGGKEEGSVLRCGGHDDYGHDDDGHDDYGHDDDGQDDDI